MTLAPPAMAATREALGPTLVRLREEGLDIVVVDADSRHLYHRPRLRGRLP